MKMITVKTGEEIFQVKLEVKDGSRVYILVLSLDQSHELYREVLILTTHQTAMYYKNEFTKADAKKVVARYLSYMK